MAKYSLTKYGKAMVDVYLSELKAKRKEILDAGKDTAEETNLPTAEEIVSDIEFIGLDEEDDYYNCWAVTDHYSADYPLLLKRGRHFIEL